ncbi:hypothetical protein DL240_07655 [Lujinxingia litoralis]|uniref:Lipoprotein-releasing system transmembrane subunit LolC n=1 Tax=Lujinxingia litoralis TaxID=2211119 RepID=A0A328C6A0_9DELT|nr:ABC transporter permease [Lujinxingia litoralis]RAL22766.1 hypothetical protein DL240_07655 [Lujinxingia litoralis]
MSYERFIAWRHLRSKRTSFLSTITLIAILGVFLGVTALTSVVAVTGGFEEAFRERVLGVNSHLMVIKYGVDFRDYREIQEEIDEIEGVSATSPFILHEMIATHGNLSAGILIKGIDPATAQSVSDLPKYTLEPGVVSELEFERFPADGQVKQPRILIGHTLAERLGAERGDVIQVTSPLESLDPGKWSSKSSAPSSRQFEVAGIYRSGFHQYDNRMVMVDYQALQDFFNQGDTVTGVDVRVDDVFGVGAIASQLRRDLPEGRFRVMDWRQLNHNLFTSLGLQRLVLAVLFCFIVLVASFNIVCTLIMIVLEKNKDIAILKSMGATNWGVMKTFIYQGAVVGFVGTASGLVGGLAVCLTIKHTSFGLDPSIYMIDHLPVRMLPLEFAMVGLVSMAISLLATVGPSWWASRLNPVDGLRYD